MNSKPRRASEDDISEGSKKYYAKFASPHSPSGEVTRLQLEPQLPVLFTTQTERDQQIRRYRAEVAIVRAELEVKKSELEAQTSLVMQRDAELVNMQSKLRDTEAKLDDSLLSHDQQIRRYRAEVANVRAELEVKKSELEAQTSLVKQRDAVLVDMQLRLRNTGSNLDELLLSRDQQIRRYKTELEYVCAELEAKKSELEVVREANACTLHTARAASIIDLNEDRSMYGLKDDDLESLQCNE